MLVAFTVFIWALTVGKLIWKIKDPTGWISPLWTDYAMVALMMGDVLLATHTRAG